MFDLRYHVASLAAVFLMLVVGILIGIGISGRGFVSDAERTRLNREITDLRERLEVATAGLSDLELRQQAAQDFVESAYPVLAENRLAGKRIGVLVLGPVDRSSFEFVRDAVEVDSGGRIERMRAVTLPLRLDAVEATLTSNRELAGYVGEEHLGNLGRDLGRELVAGRETPLWDALQGEIVEERSGAFMLPVDGVVVIRSAEPQAGPTARFLAGLYPGLGSTGEPVAGVEPTRVEQSAIPVFQRHQLSTVDGIDTELGQLALVLLLADARPGDYGVRDTADGILPPIEPLPAASD